MKRKIIVLIAAALLGAAVLSACGEDETSAAGDVAATTVAASTEATAPAAETTASTEGTFGESGTGIGLFVSQQMMERNGGTIAIESEEGKGTMVTLSVKK